MPEEYILVYFLDNPTEAAVSYIAEVYEKFNIPIISIPYKFKELSRFDNLQYRNAGPEQFINLINNAKFVCTDSFHGMIFSVNLNTPFYIFQRNYGTATDQSSRIVSILEKLKLKERFVSEVYSNDVNKDKINVEINFEESNKLLQEEREKSIRYLNNAFSSIKIKNKRGNYER